MAGHVTVHIDVGEPETGIWCNDCQLSARCRFPLLHLTERGVSHIATVERCVHCLGYDTDEDLDDTE